MKIKLLGLGWNRIDGVEPLRSPKMRWVDLELEVLVLEVRTKKNWSTRVEDVTSEQKKVNIYCNNGEKPFKHLNSKKNEEISTINTQLSTQVKQKYTKTFNKIMFTSDYILNNIFLSWKLSIRTFYIMKNWIYTYIYICFYFIFLFFIQITIAFFVFHL